MFLLSDLFVLSFLLFFFFNDPATTEIYTYCHTLSLHDALPICGIGRLLAGMRSPPRALHAHPLLPADEPLASLPVVVLDTETTGLNVRRDRKIGRAHV